MQETSINTKLIHMGKDAHKHSAVIQPIVLTTTFERAEDQIGYNNNYIYGRYDNPNRRVVEEKLAALEHGAACVTFASGLAASTAIIHSLRSGDHIIIPDDMYFGIKKIISIMYQDWGLEYTAVNMADLDHVAAAIKTNTKIIWMETPSNPMVKICDIAAIVSIAKNHEINTVVDNTWATPFFTNPILLGVDIVMHSTTKYLGGHSDITGGALIFGQLNEKYEFIRAHQATCGAVPSPFDCWLLDRSLATFPLRMPVHASNAFALALYLDKHAEVEQVMYPGLSSDSGHSVAVKQMHKGFGGMLSFTVKQGKEASLEVCRRLQLVAHATSLGGVESLIEHRKSVEHNLSTTPDNLLRVSVGIEDIDDLIRDFEQSFLGL